MKVLIVTPQIEPSSGGIQRYSFALSSALVNLLGAKNIEVHSLLDVSAIELENPTKMFVASGERSPFILRLVARCFAFQPTFIWFTHANLSPLGYYLKTCFGIPYIVSAHGVEVWSAVKPQVGKALRSAKFVCAVSTFTAGVLLRKGKIKTSQLILLPNTVDEKHFTSSKSLFKQMYSPKNRSKDKPFTMLTINRFERQEAYKGYRVVLQAFPEIVASIPHVQWIIGGKGNDLDGFRQAVLNSGLSDHIQLPGFIPESDLPRLYGQADLFVMPSALEGFGIVYLESMCCGTPCLAGNQDGARDPLRNGKVGFCVDPYSPRKIAEAVISYSKGESHISPLSSFQLRQQCIFHYGSTIFHRRLKRILTRFFDAP